MSVMQQVRRRLGLDDPDPAAQAQTLVPAEVVPARATREEAVLAIMSGTGCTRALADSTLTWIGGFVERSRTAGYDYQYPTTDQMMTAEYGVFDRVFQHGQQPIPGSAASIVVSFLLDPAMDEFTIIHDQQDRAPHFCRVRVVIGIMVAIG